MVDKMKKCKSCNKKLVIALQNKGFYCNNIDCNLYLEILGEVDKDRI